MASHNALDIASGRALDEVQLRDRRELMSAFEMFNELSEQLTDSYRAMEDRVGELNSELHRVAEERLRELREKERVSQRLESLLNLLPAGVVVLDQKGVVSQCNPAAVELLGEPLLGQRWMDVIRRAFSPRGDDGHEISLRDGRRVSLATRSLEGEPGQLVLLTDLTETRALQQRLARHQRLSEMGRMMSSLAHQIRTPLSAALLYTGHLCEPGLNEEQSQRFANKVRSRLNHLEQQVRDMLTFARGDVRLTDTIRVEELLAAIRQALEVPLQSSGATCQIEGAARSCLIHCNRDSVVGAVLNLVNNAIEATGKGAAIRLECCQQGPLLALTVSDNGPGFDADVAAQLTEPFFTTKSQGTGLGLAVVRAVAQAHGGEFAIKSQPGAGTQARLYLPLAAGADSDEVDHE